MKIGNVIRSNIYIENYTPDTIEAGVQKELWTDSQAWHDIPSGGKERWGRKAGRYTLWLRVEGKQYDILLEKKGSDVTIKVYGDKDF